jgi:hypothetical protein
MQPSTRTWRRALGFAYRLNGREDTVIRGGFGTYYGIPAIQTWNSANGLGAPFLLSKSFTGPTPSKATGITGQPISMGTDRVWVRRYADCEQHLDHH